MVDLPTCEVGTADIPPFTLAVRSQDECPLSRTRQNPYSAHPFLLHVLPEKLPDLSLTRPSPGFQGLLSHPQWQEYRRSAPAGRFRDRRLCTNTGSARSSGAPRSARPVGFADGSKLDHAAVNHQL